MSIFDRLFSKKEKERRDSNTAAHGSKEAAELPIPKEWSLKALVIADPHNSLVWEDCYPIDLEGYDVCIVLGDVGYRDISMIEDRVAPCLRCIGIPGNHDTKDVYRLTSVEDISGRTTMVGDIRIAGIGGGFKYKNADGYCMYTDEESSEIASLIPKADILISHDSPKYMHTERQDEAHSGLIGVSEYLDEHKPPLAIHGHYHEAGSFSYKGTRCLCVYGVQTLEIKDGNVTITNVMPKM